MEGAGNWLRRSWGVGRVWGGGVALGSYHQVALALRCWLWLVLWMCCAVLCCMRQPPRVGWILLLPLLAACAIARESGRDAVPGAWAWARQGQARAVPPAACCREATVSNDTAGYRIPCTCGGVDGWMAEGGVHAVRLRCRIFPCMHRCEVEAMRGEGRGVRWLGNGQLQTQLVCVPSMRPCCA